MPVYVAKLNGYQSTPENPRPYKTVALAMNEAGRLADLQPGEKYGVLMWRGFAEAPKPKSNWTACKVIPGV